MLAIPVFQPMMPCMPQLPFPQPFAGTVPGGVRSPPSLPLVWQSQFEIVKEMPVLGSGAFGTIFHVRDRGNQRTFAVKVMQRSHYELRGMGSQIGTEIQAMQKASSVCSDPGWSRVVHLHGVVEEAGFVFLLLELCVHGNLAQQLAKNPSGLCEASAARTARHLLQGLRDIHAAGIIHRDIKPGNLLITTNGVLKIADFGWAAEAREAPRGLAGTWESMAPEVLKETKAQTTAVDLWSAGAVIYNVVTGRKLMTSENPQALLREIKKKCPLDDGARPCHVSEACWDLLQRLLEPNVKQRITAGEALQHPWLRADKSLEYLSSRGGA